MGQNFPTSIEESIIDTCWKVLLLCSEAIGKRCIHIYTYIYIYKYIYLYLYIYIYIYIYLDDLSEKIAESGIGCHIGDVLLNQFAYAVDLALDGTTAGEINEATVTSLVVN